MKPSSCCHGGFSLIELLVVIGILTVLAALLFPPLNRAKDQAKQAYCRNNLRQINLGVRLYADDSNGLSPGAGTNNYIAFVVYKEFMKTT